MTLHPFQGGVKCYIGSIWNHAQNKGLEVQPVPFGTIRVANGTGQQREISMSGTLNISERLQQQRGREARSESLATRFTRAEQTVLENAAAANGKTLREWSRDVLLREARASRTDPLFTEVVALRMMLNNLLRPLSCGETITADDFNAHMAEIRTTKKKVARDILQQYAATSGKEQ